MFKPNYIIKPPKCKYNDLENSLPVSLVYPSKLSFRVHSIRKRILFGTPSWIRTRNPMQHSPQAKLRVCLTHKNKKKSHSDLAVCTYFGGSACRNSDFCKQNVAFRDLNPGPNATFAAGENKSLSDSQEQKEKPFRSCWCTFRDSNPGPTD